MLPNLQGLPAPCPSPWEADGETLMNQPVYLPASCWLQRALPATSTANNPEPVGSSQLLSSSHLTISDSCITKEAQAVSTLSQLFLNMHLLRPWLAFHEEFQGSSSRPYPHPSGTAEDSGRQQWLCQPSGSLASMTTEQIKC